jgi:hypothetical protein
MVRMLKEGLSLLFALAASASAAQEDGALSRAIAAAKAMPTAGTDAARDSLSAVLKQALRSVLDRPEGLTVRLDSLPLSRVDAPDGRFRIITWNVPRRDGSHGYEGLLLVREGQRHHLHELRDRTDQIAAPEVPELGVNKWYGALYYDMVPVRRAGRTWYTLLGWKGYSKVETRKVIEVLWFRGAQPRFGAPLFGEGKLKRTRQVFGYSFQATMLLRHDKEQGRIILDHLSPARPDLEGQWAFYGPDLSYDAYVWDKDHWRLQRDVDVRDPRRDPRPFNAPPPPAKP